MQGTVLQVYVKQMPETLGGTALEFMGEVRLRVCSEERRGMLEIKGVPAVFVGKSTRQGLRGPASTEEEAEAFVG